MNIKYMCFCVFIKKFVVIQNNYKITLKLCRENCHTKIKLIWKNIYIYMYKEQPLLPQKGKKIQCNTYHYYNKALQKKSISSIHFTAMQEQKWLKVSSKQTPLESHQIHLKTKKCRPY